MEISASFVNLVSQTTKMNSVSAYSTEESKVNYNKYTTSELRDIPYEEAKNNYTDIMKRIEELNQDKVSMSVSAELVATTFQMNKVNYSGNENFNKSLYETEQSLSVNDALALDFELSINLQDYSAGMNINASFVKGTGNEELHSNKSLSNKQFSNINLDDFLSKMIETFTQNHNETKGVVKEQFQGVLSAYEHLKKNYESNLKEPFYA